MARHSSKRKESDELAQALREIPQDRPGLPALDSIVGAERFVSPQQDEYTILHTTEVDAYDEPPKPPATRRRRKL